MLNGGDTVLIFKSFPVLALSEHSDCGGIITGKALSSDFENTKMNMTPSLLLKILYKIQRENK